MAALETLVCVISEGVGRTLERQGLLVRDLESSFLLSDSPDGAGFEDLLGHSIIYRIALGPHQGRKAFTLQTVPAVAAVDDSSSVAKAAGFSLHAGVAQGGDGCQGGWVSELAFCPRPNRGGGWVSELAFCPRPNRKARPQSSRSRIDIFIGLFTSLPTLSLIDASMKRKRQALTPAVCMRRRQWHYRA